jgi:hypothetical protein
MTEVNVDPPITLYAAQEKFSHFLASQNHPSAICWVERSEVLVDTKRRYWVRPRQSMTTRRAALRYAEGLERNLGIELRAMCATETETFASVFIPEDERDAQYHLMGGGLKLSCPIERYSTSVIRNPFRWLTLSLFTRQRSRMREI